MLREIGSEVREARYPPELGHLDGRRVVKIAKPTGSKLMKGPAESGKICSVKVEEK
jgi:hypothetical protein